MLRIYCDTNIYSLIKESHPNFNFKLKETMDSLKEILLFTYSFAHLEDKSRTKKEHIHLLEEDFNLLKNYVQDNYFLYDETDKNTHFYLAEPNDAFRGFNFENYNNILTKGFNYEYFFGELNDDEFGENFSKTIKSLFDIPVINPRNEIVNNDFASNEYLDKIFPKEELTTYEELLNKMMSFSKDFLNEKSEMKKLKGLVADYVNRDEYSFEKWKDDFDKKFSDTTMNVTFSEMMEKSFNINNNYSDYDKFLLYYSCLELYNITKETSSGKSKSFNFKSLQNDAKHAWYASFSDYLVTDDKGLQAKAYISYKYFKINTKILTLEEFQNSKELFLNQEENYYKDFTDTLIFENKNSLIIKGNSLNDFSSIVKTNHIFFNYFNRIKRSENMLTLYCERGEGKNNLMYREVQIIIKKIIKLFGIDFKNKGYYDIEKEKDLDVYRIWKIGDITIKLWNARISSGTTLCLDLIVN